MSATQQNQDRQNAGGLIPDGMDVVPFDVFTGLNTNASRPGIKDTETSICDGFFPIGDSFLRVLPGVGAPIFNAQTAGAPPLLVFGFANIGPLPFCFAFPTDGSIWAINTNTLVATEIAPASTIATPSVATVAVSQFNGTTPVAQIVAQQTNGYFVFDGTVFYQAGGVSPNIDITAGGSGYTSAPSISVASGSGSGATFDVSLTDGVVTAIVPTAPGTGYLASDTQTQNLTISGGGGSGATATIDLMPFGIGGSDLICYVGRVWIINGVNLIFSAPGSYTDFSTADGGGVTPSNDSTLRVTYTGIVSTNGFLYLIGDSNLSYISGVSTTTSGSTTTTTFSLQNADPQTGTPYAGTVTLLGQDVVFANSFGVQVSYGGRVTKASDQLDGIYATVPNFGGLMPSAAIATIFGKRVWMLLIQVLDQVSGQPVNKLMMWDRKKWWTSQQDLAMAFVGSQEINSVLMAYATDGNVIAPLFQQPSVNFVKTVQSKLFARPHYMIGKVASRVWGLLQYYALASLTLAVSIDSETSSSPVTLSAGIVVWTNNSGAPVVWTNAAGRVVVWYAQIGTSGIAVLGPTAVAQQGALIGMTISTAGADLAILSMAIGTEPMQYRG